MQSWRERDCRLWLPETFSQGASIRGGEQGCGDSLLLEGRLMCAFESAFD